MVDSLSWFRPKIDVWFIVWGFVGPPFTRGEEHIILAETQQWQASRNPMAQEIQPGQLTDLARLALNAPASQDQMLAEVSRLRREYSAARLQLTETETKSGPLAHIVNYAKNHLGGDPHSTHYLSSMWGGIIDQTQGSQALEKESAREQTALNQLQKNAQFNESADFSGTYKQLTGASFLARDPQPAHLPLGEQVAFYQRSQARMVDSLADGCGALAATLVQWRFKNANYSPIIAAAVTKVLAKSTEPLYGHAVRDASTGAIDGLSIVIAGRLGSRTNSLLGELPTGKTRGLHIAGRAAVVEGLSGGIFGAITGPVREYFAAKDSKTPITAHDLAHAAVRDAKTGFVLGLPFAVRF
jgi:hypothetical protein